MAGPRWDWRQYWAITRQAASSSQETLVPGAAWRLREPSVLQQVLAPILGSFSGFLSRWRHAGGPPYRTELCKLRALRP